MGTFDGETFTPLSSQQPDSSVDSQVPVPTQYSIKAGVCLHHIFYSTQLPWSGTELDFERRYCDACLARQGLAGIDLNADLACHGEGDADINLNGDFSFLHGCDLGVESTSAEGLSVEDMDQVLDSFVTHGSLMDFGGEEGLAGEAMQGMDFDPLVEPEPIVEYMDHCCFSSSSELRITSAEHCEKLPETQLTWFETQKMAESNDNTEEASEYEDEEMEDAFDEEPPSPEIGVSFSPEHIWPGENIAREEPGYSSDYRLLDDDE